MKKKINKEVDQPIMLRKMTVFIQILSAVLLLFSHDSHSTFVEEMHVNHDTGNTGQTTTKTFSLASYYGDHMVLQGAPYKARIWGYGPKGSNGSSVVVRVGDDIKITTLVEDDLTWNVAIGPVKSGGPYTITAEQGASSLKITDVLFGDVWLCSGQSNMEFSINQVFNASFEQNDSLNYPDIRIFTAERNTASKPLDDLASISRNWSIPSPESFGTGVFDKGFSAVCWLYGKYLYQTLKKPIGLLETSWGGTPVEAWSSKEALSKCGLNPSKQTLPATHRQLGSPFGGPQDYMVLWNAMVNPLKKLTVYGAIWYQGENNAKLNKDLYACTFPTMIDDWRLQFSSYSGTQNLFPFGFVQLDGNSPDYNEDNGFADIRWHQTADHGFVPNTRLKQVFMAVAMDLPDFVSPYGSIHPRDKQDVAARLVRGGLAVAYGYKVSYQGPILVTANVHVPSSMKFPVITIEYNTPITLKWMEGFEVCCAFTTPPVCDTGKAWWLPSTTAQGLIENSTTTYVMQCALDNVVGFRYAWRDSPCGFKECSVYGAENDLPLAPFSYIISAEQPFVNKEFVLQHL